jgi:hypothetical protein
MKWQACLLAMWALCGRAELLTAQSPSDVAQRFLDAVRVKDENGLRSLVDATARVVSTASDKGAPVVRSITLAEFINSVMNPAQPFDKPWDERMWNAKVLQDGNLALVWTSFDFRQEQEVKYCGVLAIQMVRSAAGWRISQVAESQRSPPCPGQPK